MKFQRCLLWLLFLCGTLSAAAVPTTNGLYAAFNTSRGVFYARLDYDKVPRTVANFIGLAEGNRPWVNYFTARIETNRFYDGLTFHRVVTNFVIQGGSRNGNGTDDPGYRFQDEFHPALNHNRAGMLSMANSGPDSNGSQFFVTLTNTSFLNLVHSVFGQVVEGISVVQAIGNVATDSAQKPLVPVVINSINILRIGSAASNFVASAVTPPLPTPNYVQSSIAKDTNGVLLTWAWRTGNEYRVFLTEDFRTWFSTYIGTQSGSYINNLVSTRPQNFFFTIESEID